MYIKNRIFALVFRAALVFGCGYGLSEMSGLFGGGFNVNMLAYYTNLSNIAAFLYAVCAVVYTAYGIARHGVRGTSTLLPSLRCALMMTITITMVVYHFVLAPMMFDMNLNYQVHGLSDILIHYFTPLMFIADWLLFGEKRRIRRAEPLLWLIIPFAYLVYIMIRAEVAAPLTASGTRYPYFFLDLDMFTPLQVTGNILACLGAFTAMGYVFYFIDKIPVLASGFAQTAQINRDIDV